MLAPGQVCTAGESWGGWGTCFHTALLPPPHPHLYLYTSCSYVLLYAWIFTSKTMKHVSTLPYYHPLHPHLYMNTSCSEHNAADFAVRVDIALRLITYLDFKQCNLQYSGELSNIPCFSLSVCFQGLTKSDNKYFKPERNILIELSRCPYPFQ